MANEIENVEHAMKEYIEKNHPALRKAYVEYIDEKQDGVVMKAALLNSEACFEEWVLQRIAQLNKKEVG